MKKTIIIISSMLMVTLVAGSVFATGQGKRNNRGQGMGYNQDCPRYGGQNAMANLTEEQKDQFSALRQKLIDETYELRSEQLDNQQKMRMLMETSNPDRAKIDKLSEKIGNVQIKLRNKMIDFQLAAKKIAPELGKGRGFGSGKGFMSQSNRGGQRGCQGQRGGGCWQNNN